MKKKYSILLLIALAIFITFTGCKKDKKPKNEFTFDGDTYVLDNGFMVNFWGNVLVMFTDNNIKFVENNENFFTGKGNAIVLLMHSASYKELLPGTYEYSTDEGTFTFDEGVVCINYDVVKEEGDFHECIGGSAKVSIDGSIYTFDILFELSDKKEAKIHYEGELKDLTDLVPIDKPFKKKFI